MVEMGYSRQNHMIYIFNDQTSDPSDRDSSSQGGHQLGRAVDDFRKHAQEAEKTGFKQKNKQSGGFMRFPSMGGTPKWMLNKYKEKSYQHG